MDIFVNAIDTTISFTKETLNKAKNVWDSFDEDEKKLYIGCAIAAVCVIFVAIVCYGIGKAQGRKIALEDEFD